MNRYVLNVSADNCMALASSTALVKAINNQMTLVKTHGDLTWIAKACSVISGGGLDPTLDWKVIRPRHAALTKDYHRMLLQSIERGPTELHRTASRMAEWYSKDASEIATKFAKAEQHNNAAIARATAGFQIARAVRITALGSLALLSGVGGVVGSSATISAFGVQSGLAGLSFSQGLLFGVGAKSAYNVATNWDKSTGQIAAVVVWNGLNDAAAPVRQEAVGIGVELAFYGQLRKWARELHLGQETESMITLMQRQLANQVKKSRPDKKVVERLERRLAAKTAEQASKQTSQRVAKYATRTLGALPVVWLAEDLWGIYKEADADMALL